MASVVRLRIIYGMFERYVHELLSFVAVFTWTIMFQSTVIVTTSRVDTWACFQKKFSFLSPAVSSSPTRESLSP